MRALAAVMTLLVVALPAFAPPPPPLPEPESMALFAIGAVGLLLARRKKK